MAIRVDCERRRGDDGAEYWAAKSDPFAITVYGKTLREAESRLFQAIEVFVGALEEKGALEEYLTSRQIPFVRVDKPPTKLSGTRELVVSVGE